MSIRDKELRAKLTPDYDFGCKRPTYSNSYYRTLAKPNVHLQTSGIERVEADGIVACDGTKAEIDTLVLCTGFDIWEANIPAIEIIGRDARNLGKWWRDNGFQAYQGVTIPAFPNFLSLAGPYASSGLSYFNTMEYQMRHMDRLFGELQPARRDHVRGDRGRQHQFPRADVGEIGQDGVPPGRLRALQVLLLQPDRRDVGAARVDQRDQPRERQLPARRLHVRLNAAVQTPVTLGQSRRCVSMETCA